jgi:uncharacterized protein DUF4382/carboxypeptidase family protein
MGLATFLYAREVTMKKARHNMSHIALGLWMGIGLLALVLIGGCGSGGATGRLSLNLGASGISSSNNPSAAGLTIASSSDVESVFVTIKEVQVHLSGDGEVEDNDQDSQDETDAEEGPETQEETGDESENQDADNDNDEEGGWITVAMPNETFNLMDLRNCLLEKLGSAKLTAGQSVTQIRLILSDTATEGHPFANYVVIAGEPQEIKVPSGSETGIKINPQGPVDIQEDGEVHVTLRIDLDKSLVFTGEGKILFKPVVLASVGGETADAFVNGHVTSAADGSAIADATISANVADSDPVVVENATTTDADGNYSLCVAPGTYDMMVTKDGFKDATTQIDVSGEETVTVDFSLEAL